MKKIANLLIKYFALFLVRIHLLRKMIVVRVDGGICSQMHFFLVGEQLARKGYIVKYNLRWFQKDGMDLTGKFCRNFDLEKAFPSLHIDEPSPLEAFLYTRLPIDRNKTHLEAKPPVYLNGYYGNNFEMMTILYPQLFKLNPNVFDDVNREIYNKIKKCTTSIAIHVRRGDLANYHRAYGKPVDLTYFVKALDIIHEKNGEAHCFLFSDEPEWVKNHLINELPTYNQYEIISVNGSDKGYFDMFLISACKFQITSKGSLGKYGGLLNNTPGKHIYVYDDQIERTNWDGVNDEIQFV